MNYIQVPKELWDKIKLFVNAASHLDLIENEECSHGYNISKWGRSTHDHDCEESRLYTAFMELDFSSLED